MVYRTWGRAERMRLGMALHLQVQAFGSQYPSLPREAGQEQPDKHLVPTAGARVT